MIETLIVLLVMAILVALILGYPVALRQRRSRVQQRPFSPVWQTILEQTLPFYPRLTPTQQHHLQGHMQVFLAEKQFIGCAGLQVTETMRVTIAAIACLLLLHDRGEYFPKLRSILIYPSAYRVNASTPLDQFMVEERLETRLGESWTRDQVVLAWDTVQWDTTHWRDGHNLVLHEFAHQLDQADGHAEGVPILASPTDYANWRQVMTQAYQQLCRAVAQGHPTVLDRYGATNEAEFFAVATETFFEQPRRMRRAAPALYEQLRRYYQLDPIEWL